MARRSDAWVFVSHSNDDLPAVRRVRNELESYGANPILFFLKCVTRDDELEDLIKREIRARHFFLLCESDSAEKSNWVKQELAFVRSLPHKQRRDLVLRNPWPEQQVVIRDLLEQATVYISYAHADRARVLPDLEFLASEDMAIFDPAADLAVGSSWADVLGAALDDAARGGHLIQFLSTASLASQWAEHEFGAYVEATGALRGGRSPILLSLDPLEELPAGGMRSKSQILDASRQPFAQSCEALLRALGL